MTTQTANLADTIKKGDRLRIETDREHVSIPSDTVIVKKVVRLDGGIRTRVHVWSEPYNHGYVVELETTTCSVVLL